MVCTVVAYLLQLLRTYVACRISNAKTRDIQFHR